MRAQPHDHIVVRGHHVGDHDRRGEIVAVEGSDGGPPYRVHWNDTEHVTLFYPGDDATVVPTVPRST